MFGEFQTYVSTYLGWPESNKPLMSESRTQDYVWSVIMSELCCDDVYNQTTCVQRCLKIVGHELPTFYLVHENISVHPSPRTVCQMETHACQVVRRQSMDMNNLCLLYTQMLLWWTNNSPHFIKVWDIVSKVVSSCLVDKVPFLELTSTVRSWFLQKMANLSMLFILEMVCTSCVALLQEEAVDSDRSTRPENFHRIRYCIDITPLVYSAYSWIRKPKKAWDQQFTLLILHFVSLLPCNMRT